MRTVPTLLQEHVSVRFANLAIHALIDAKRPQWVEEGPVEPGKDSYSRALRYHGQALTFVREKPANSTSLQSATLCCLFFVVFEMMNGDVNAAQAHMFNGCRMMDELRGVETSRPSTHGIENMLFREIQKAMRFVAMQLHGAVSSHGQTSSIKQEVAVKVEAEDAAEGLALDMDAIVIKQEPRTPSSSCPP